MPTNKTSTGGHSDVVKTTHKTLHRTGPYPDPVSGPASHYNRKELDRDRSDLASGRRQNARPHVSDN